MELVIVDDEVRVTESLSREIRLELGEDDFAVSKFTDPLEAIPYIEKNHTNIFLVITDLRMPNLKGSELIKQVHSSFPDIQTILLTAYTDIDEIQKAVHSSILSLIIKPWSREDLCYEVKRAFDLYTLRKENEILRNRLQDMLSAAGDFQRQVYAHSIPESEDIRFDVAYKPCVPYQSGGDFYYIKEIEPGHFLVILGDTTGHGYKSAMISMMFSTALKVLLETKPALKKNLPQLVEHLNRFCTSCICLNAPDALIGISVLGIHIPDRRMEVVIAGMPPILYIGQEQQEAIRSENPMLGVSIGTECHSITYPIFPGDRIILFTDGLIESISSASNLSSKELINIAVQSPDYSAETIYKTYRNLMPNYQFTDDVTILSMEIAQGIVKNIEE
ncbi:MAG TPA: SpoIIE family protein phosphatase [Spirochaetales bacterium]|nr:SpoIIE family protein phosphatase [Spirochaetales bacterium]